MTLTKVLITVKTYPTVSSKYEELVCTAGFREDGTWIRIYPIQFRKKTYEQQYSKYDWIEIDLVKNTSDFRPESFRPYSFDSDIKILESVSTAHYWRKRKEIALKNVYYDLSALIAEAKNPKITTSLAVFKPSKIKAFTVEAVDRKWDPKKIAKLEAERLQGNLFKQPEDPFDVVNKLPYKFSYVLEDAKGVSSTMMIEDWEIGQLYWNCLARHEGDEVKTVNDVRKKYFDEFVFENDLYLFLGTTQLHHYVSRNPFMIIGVFYPKIEQQLSLF